MAAGKSTVLETLLRQDIEAGEGCAVVDPHGDLVEHLRASVPENRLSDLIVFDPGDPEGHVGFNPLAGVLENKLGAYLTDPRLRNVLTVPRGLDLRRIMNERKILLVNLSKGKLGEGPAMLLGSLLPLDEGDRSVRMPVLPIMYM